MTASRRVDYHPTCPTKTVNASAWTTTKAKNVAMIRIPRRTHSVFLWAIFSVLAASSTSRASGLADLTAVVLRHDNYKVRLQAAAVLARRRARARSGRAHAAGAGVAGAALPLAPLRL